MESSIAHTWKSFSFTKTIPLVAVAALRILMSGLVAPKRIRIYMEFAFARMFWHQLILKPTSILSTEYYSTHFSNSCAFWHLSGTGTTDRNNEVNTGDLWNGGSGTCNTGILQYYWSENDSGLSTQCGPASVDMIPGL